MPTASLAVMCCACDWQREHQISLVPQQVFVEPLDGDDHRGRHHGHHCNKGEQAQQPGSEAEHRPSPARSAGQHQYAAQLYGQRRRARQHQNRAQYGQKNTRRRLEFMFDEFR